MPKLLLRKIIFIGLMIAWFNGLIISPALASTDPINATVSATATVPTTSATTSDDRAPTPPILIRPIDDAITGDNSPEFVWRQSSDPNGNTITYVMYLNGVATYLGISNFGNSSGANYTARIDDNEIKLIPSASLADGSYHWYVTASDPSGNTSQSTIWDFTIDTTPPPLTLVDLDNYHNPVITDGASFDIAGPKDVYFTVLSDPSVEVQIALTSPDSQIYLLKSNTDSQGLAYLYHHLTPGTYTVSIVAIDHSLNTTVLPDFTLTITQAQVTVPLPPFIDAPDVVIPYTPITIPSLPATIAKIESRLPLAYLAIIMLAIAVALLLIFLWKRRFNLILLDDEGNAIMDATIYHSIPTKRSPYSPILVTKLTPISYLLSPSNHGRLYIHHLNRYSTLTIRLDYITYIFSMSASRKLYTIVLG